MTRRYPLAPLFELTGWTMTQVRQVAPCGGEEYRHRVEHGVTERIADRLACAAGLHPHVVWPEMADHAAADASTPCEECEQPFMPSRAGQVFCSKRCRKRKLQREWKRRRYQTDPAYAAAVRQARREFYEACGDYERARERRKYHARKRAA